MRVRVQIETGGKIYNSPSVDCESAEKCADAFRPMLNTNVLQFELSDGNWMIFGKNALADAVLTVVDVDKENEEFEKF